MRGERRGAGARPRGAGPRHTTYALAGRERTGPTAPSDAPVPSVAAPPGRLRRPAPQARRRSTRIRAAAGRSRGSRFNRSSPLRLRPLTHAPRLVAGLDGVVDLHDLARRPGDLEHEPLADGQQLIIPQVHENGHCARVGGRGHQSLVRGLGLAGPGLGAHLHPGVEEHAARHLPGSAQRPTTQNQRTIRNRAPPRICAASRSARRARRPPSARPPGEPGGCGPSAAPR